jgi:hypothetical protein
MTVVKFPHATKLAAGWPEGELRRVLNVCAESIATGGASGWEFAKTENGDPQIYLLGPPPDCDCILSISRLGNFYIVEDGNGRVLFEHQDPVRLAEQAAAALRRRKSAIVARIAIAWCAVREAIEEKTDAMVGESFDLLTHMAPQLATLA